MRRLTCLCAAALLVTAAARADASLVLTIAPAPTYTAGTFNNSFDIIITGAPPGDVVDSFQINLSALAASGLTFTGVVNPAPSPYLFTVPMISVLSGGGTNTLSYTDVDLSLPLRPATTVNTGDIFGVGRIFFDLAPSATIGPNAVTPTFVEFLDPVGNNISVVSSPGVINVVSPAAVPEPSSVVLLGLAGVGGLALRLRKRKGDVAGETPVV